VSKQTNDIPDLMYVTTKAAAAKLDITTGRLRDKAVQDDFGCYGADAVIRDSNGERLYRKSALEEYLADLEDGSYHSKRERYLANKQFERDAKVNKQARDLTAKAIQEGRRNRGRP